MLRKGCFFAAAALGAFSALTAAHAQPVSIGHTLQLDTIAFTTVDYYPRHYNDREGYHGDGLLGLFEIPGRILGGVAGLFTGAPGNDYYGDSYYSRPFYVSPYYGSPYRDAYNSYYGSTYYDRLYDGGSYYFSSRTGARGYYDDRRHFRPDRYEGDQEYYKEYRIYENRKYFGDDGYYRDRYYRDPDYTPGYDEDPRYSDVYDRGRVPDNADDDD